MRLQGDARFPMVKKCLWESFRKNPLLLVVVAIFFANPVTAQPTGREIVEKAVTAHGGAERIAKLRQAQVTYEMQSIVPISKEQFGVVTATVEETYDLPRVRKWVRAKTGEKSTEVLWAYNDAGFKGGYYWFQENGGPIQNLPLAKNAHNVTRPFLVIEQLVDGLGTEAELQFLGKGPQKGNKNEETLALLIHFNRENKEGEFFFGKDSGLLVGSHVSGVQMDKVVDQVTEFSDYRDVDGLMLFMRSLSTREQKKFAELTVLKVSLLDNVNRTLFDPPGSQFPWTWVLLASCAAGVVLLFWMKTQRAATQRPK